MITKEKIRIAVIKAFDKYPIPTTLGCTRAMMIATKAIDSVDECETCGGTGTIDERLGGEYFSDPNVKCPDCSSALDKQADIFNEIEKQLLDLKKAIKPFADLVRYTDGRIPVELLSLENWHNLVKVLDSHESNQIDLVAQSNNSSYL